MGNMYRVWDKMDETRCDTVLDDAKNWLAKMDAGEAV
jgi:deoxyribodipyrimidine photolyase-related protein